MRTFELLPHTADIAIRAVGSDRKEMLAAAVQGMFAAAEPRFAEGAGTVRRTFRVEAATETALIVDLLNEALYLSDTHREAYTDVDISSLAGTSVEGAFIGRPVTGFATQIKAATHHGASAAPKQDGTWEAAIIFDA